MVQLAKELSNMKLNIFIVALCIEESILIKVLTTPKFEKGKAPSDSFATLRNPSSPPLKQVSSCLWNSLNFESFAETWSSSNSFFGTAFWTGVAYLYIGPFSSTRMTIPEHVSFTPEKWRFFCFSFDNIEKVLKVYIDSEKIMETTIDNGLDNFEIESDFLKGEKFASAKKFAGQISDLNVWSKILTQDEINDMYSCKDSLETPDVLDWETAEFDLGPNLTLTVREEHPCLEKENEKMENVIYNIELQMDPKSSTVRLCNALGGIMDPPKNASMVSSLEKALNKKEECSGLWIPVFKDDYENWVDINGKNVNFTPWRQGQPNGGQNFEKCAGILSQKSSYFDLSCSYEFCFYCRIKDFIHFQLKGLCQTEKKNSIDNKYVFRPRNLIDGRPIWKGHSSSIINWNEVKQRWSISNRISKEVIATMKGESPFPIGKNRWELHSENICEDQPVNNQLHLQLSKCKKFEYSCSDGTCIPIEMKCNFVSDCFDGGDEKQCPILMKGYLQGYKSDLPHIKVNEKGQIIKKHVEISIDITLIEKIEEVASRFTSTFTLTAEWIDPRLVWRDLNEDIFLNIPSEEQKYIFWFPKIILVNSENNSEVPNDEEAKLLVKKNGELSMSSANSLHETAYFSGMENPIFFSREFNEKFKCSFNLRFFPFDTQNCFIALTAGNKVRHFIRLVGKSLDFTGDTKLATFHVINWTLETDSSSSEVDVKVNIYFKRRLAQHFLGIYLPSIFIMTVAQVKLKR